MGLFLCQQTGKDNHNEPLLEHNFDKASKQTAVSRKNERHNHGPGYAKYRRLSEERMGYGFVSVLPQRTQRSKGH